MKRFGIYFLMQMKRVVRICPAILVTTLLLCAVLGISAWAVLDRESTKEENTKVCMGLVGDLDSYMGLDMYGLLNLLSAQFGVKLVPVSEEDAPRQLRAGRIAAYAIIPDGLVEAVETGRNDKQIMYVAAEGQRGISSVIMDEVVEALSELITASQSAIYAMQNYLLDEGRGEELTSATNALNLFCIEILADIFSICRIEIVGMANRLSTVGYYVCGIVVFFLLLCSLNCSQLFTKRNMDLPRVLASRGHGAACQVLGEYLAYLLLACGFLFLFLTAVGVAVEKEWLLVPEWELAGRSELTVFSVGLFPAVLAITAMQFLLYEVVSGAVNGILAQFLGAVAMGYVAGCFYPVYIFPKALQVIVGLTPAGMALQYADKCMLGRAAWLEGGVLLLYAALMLLAAIHARRRRMEIYA